MLSSTANQTYLIRVPEFVLYYRYCLPYVPNELMLKL